eukprot:GHVL01029258.1.p1 GENE.GHVL01029258.1~~GHVL01029258.1.p1  ORF type:complete len:223 (+),score=34.46 GHVL01029258.1:290-958(+)
MGSTSSKHTSIESIEEKDIMTSELHLSAIHDIELFKKLIDKGHDINSLSEPGKLTPLYKVCLHGKKENLKTLLSMGAKHDIPDTKGYYPIHAAVINNYIDTVKVLVSHGVDINIQSKDGRTPLYYASCDPEDREYIDLIRYLIENGAKHDIPDNNGYYPIHRATIINRVDIVKVLVSHGVNINIQSKDAKDGITPIEFARVASHFGVHNANLIKYLIKNSAK